MGRGNRQREGIKPLWARVLASGTRLAQGVYAQGSRDMWHVVGKHQQHKLLLRIEFPSSA